MLRTGWIKGSFNALALALALAPAGCSQEEVSAALASGGCPPLVVYSPQFQKALAAKLRKMRETDERTIVIVHYGQMRDACRAAGT